MEDSNDILARRNAQISSLLEITQAINTNSTEQNLFRLYEFALRPFQINGMALFYNNNNEQKWQCLHHFGLNNNILQHIDPIDFQAYKNKTPLKELFGIQQTNFLTENFDWIIPIKYTQKPIAYLLLTQKNNADSNLDEKTQQQEIEFIQTLTNILIVALENKRLLQKQIYQEVIKKELDLAKQVQAMFLPNHKQLPNNPNVQLSAIYLPHHSIGGDYYDYIITNPDTNEFIMCIADVSGKGIAPALLVVNFSAVLRALVKETTNIAQLVKKLNKHVVDNTRETTVDNTEYFMSFFIAKYNPPTRTFEYINAGHPAPLLIANNPQNNQIIEEWLEAGCSLLGAVDQLPRLKQGNIILPPNATVILYTDGLTELENEQGEQFQNHNLFAFAKNNLQDKPTPAEFNKMLFKHLEQYKENKNFSDDITIYTFKV